jgi:hypothetical protein
VARDRYECAGKGWTFLMDSDKEQPITDRENFPAGEKRPPIVIDLTQVAYQDGIHEGYRKAFRDLILYMLLFMLVSALIRFNDPS